MTVRFLLVCEGSSDATLVQHIRRLLVEYGQSDPEGMSWAKGRLLTDKIRSGLQYAGDCDLLLVHRDADASEETPNAGPQKRYDEINQSVSDSGYSGAWVGMVPVRMTEAWLLLDEAEIRGVTGRLRGEESLRLPPPSQVENCPDPKLRLAEALAIASGASGRRLRRLQRDLPQVRYQLLENLPVGGLLKQVPSWVRIRDDLRKALHEL